METKFSQIKETMSLRGYYLIRDFNRLHIGVKPRPKVKPIIEHGRLWYRFDNGETASRLRNRSLVVEKFFDFGFNKLDYSYSTRVAQHEQIAADLLEIDGEYIQISFYNYKSGDKIIGLIKKDTIEVIESEDLGKQIDEALKYAMPSWS